MEGVFVFLSQILFLLYFSMKIIIIKSENTFCFFTWEVLPEANFKDSFSKP